MKFRVCIYINMLTRTVIDRIYLCRFSKTWILLFRLVTDDENMLCSPIGLCSFDIKTEHHWGFYFSQWTFRFKKSIDRLYISIHALVCVIDQLYMSISDKRKLQWNCFKISFTFGFFVTYKEIILDALSNRLPDFGKLNTCTVEYNQNIVSPL